MPHLWLVMTPRPHILVVNGRKVRQPVFIIGAPYSGADLLARALKSSQGFHLTIGQRSVMSVVYAFARSPSIQRGRGEATATVLRDAFAQAWQITAHGCLGCSPACRDAAGVNGAGICAEERDIRRYGDATPDLMYCAEGLVDAFPDARLVQIIRDGRDVVAAMLADAESLAWFKLANVDSEFPNPFFGIETEADLAAWPGLSLAGKCAMRWRGTVRAMARLRTTMPPERLTTLRYEQMLRQPAAATRAVSGFIEAEVATIGVRARGGTAGSMAIQAGGWRRALTPQQVSDVEMVAGLDLRRVGYGA
jgi:sulfotransferase family protein